MDKSSFIFDEVCLRPEKQIGLHSHMSLELSCVLCGGGTRTVGDIAGPIERGEVVLIPPGIPHRWTFDPAQTDADGNIANISVFFVPGLLDSISRTFPEIAPALSVIASQSQAISYTGNARKEIRTLLLSMRGLSAVHRLPGMIRLLVALSDISESRAAGSIVAMSRTDRRLERIRVYCDCNYARAVSLDEVARHVGMNKSALCTFMRRHTGKTLSQYVNDIRLARAHERLVHTDSTIAEIAMDCGFQNVTYFNRLFRTRYGCIPKSVRAVK